MVVAVSAAHRGEAFAGAREIIDRIKAEAPIWKKEVEGGEERWVEGTQAGGGLGMTGTLTRMRCVRFLRSSSSCRPSPFARLPRAHRARSRWRRHAVRSSSGAARS